jgi:hypothetical protein
MIIIETSLFILLDFKTSYLINENVELFRKKKTSVTIVSRIRWHYDSTVQLILCSCSILCLLWDIFPLHRHFIVYSSGFGHRSNACFYHPFKMPLTTSHCLSWTAVTSMITWRKIINKLTFLNSFHHHHFIIYW